MESQPLVGPPTGALTISQFTNTYSIGRTVTYNLIKERKLRAVKVGKRTLILRADAEAWAHSLMPLVA